MTEMFQGNHGHFSVDRKPSSCPLCHREILPTILAPYQQTTVNPKSSAWVLFSCPSEECRGPFISYYDISGPNQPFKYRESRPVNVKKHDFATSIADISPMFIEIFNQARTAESMHLDQICGLGYRKGLEFLVKDYLVTRKPDRRDAILGGFLGPCIANYVDDPRIKEVAKRAVWLGNDETHYVRKWGDQDLSDLKNLIGLTVHWIEMELLTESMLLSMQPKP